MSNAVANNTAVSDDQLIEALRTSDDFYDMPVALKDVEPELVHAIRVDVATPAAGCVCITRKDEVPTEFWAKAMKSATELSDDAIVSEHDYVAVTHWMEEDGTWHITPAGEIVYSFLEDDEDEEDED